MKEKMKSEIESITINAATFSNVQIFPTYINFFYGRNGVGKTTIADAIRNGSTLQWSETAKPDDIEILVYDAEYISRNFHSFDNLQGVFMVFEENIEIQTQIEGMEKELLEKREAYKQCETEIQKKKAEKLKLHDSVQDLCWDAVSNIRKQFASAVTSIKKKSLLETIIPIDPMAHSTKKLMDFYDTVYAKEQVTYPPLPGAGQLSCLKMPGAKYMDQVLTSSSDTPFAQFIEALNAANWVHQGNVQFIPHSNGKCPFCQQELPESFNEEIKKAFDAKYASYIAAIQDFGQAYLRESQEILVRLESNLKQNFPHFDTEKYCDKLELLKKTFQMNFQRITVKLNSPDIVSPLDDTSEILFEIQQIIDDTNEQIRKANKLVEDSKNQRVICKSQVTELIAWILKKDIDDYKLRASVLDEEIQLLIDKRQTITDEGNQLKTEINALKENMTNTQGTMKDINALLKNSGFQGFRLREKNGVENVYEVVRSNGIIADKLSEGERNFIAFLYFYCSVRGSFDQKQQKNKIVVIDDPVSSMDSSALFIISTLVREMIEVCYNNIEYRNQRVSGDYIKQIFVLTHNAYFHKEISYKQVERYRGVDFYLIQKADNKSTIHHCIRKSQKEISETENYNPVKNSYAELWEEYRQLSTPTAIVNVIWRILEYYFVQLNGYENADLKQEIVENHRDCFVTINADGARILHFTVWLHHCFRVWICRMVSLMVSI